MNTSKTPLTLTSVGNGYLGPGVTKFEDFSNLSKRIFEVYDTDKGGELGYTEVSNIMISMYKSMNKSITPTKGEIEAFQRLLDANRDKRVDAQDVEMTVKKHLKVDLESTRTRTGSRPDIGSSGLIRQGSRTDITASTASKK